jgi:voltage-gated sodium channel
VSNATPDAYPTNGFAALRRAADRLVERPGFSAFIIVVIALNAVTLGLETSPAVMATPAGAAIMAFDAFALAIFTVEIGLKLIAKGPRFFRSGWNVFDFVIVAVALTPASGAFSVLRALRILRVLRLMSIVPQMRAVVGALLKALPGMGSIIAVLGLVFYVAAVIATKLFAETFPEWFGNVGASMFSLFQIMTLESWSMGIVRPVMEVHPWAWAFFVPFIIVTSFAVLNLFIGLIVNSLQLMQSEEEHAERDAAEAAAHDERLMVLDELRALRREIAEMRGGGWPDKDL